MKPSLTLPHVEWIASSSDIDGLLHFTQLVLHVVEATYMLPCEEDTLKAAADPPLYTPSESSTGFRRKCALTSYLLNDEKPI